MAAILPFELTDTITRNHHTFRGRFNYDAHVGMIAVIQMAHMQRVFPNLSKRMTELLDDIEGYTYWESDT